MESKRLTTVDIMFGVCWGMMLFAGLVKVISYATGDPVLTIHHNVVWEDVMVEPSGLRHLRHDQRSQDGNRQLIP